MNSQEIIIAFSAGTLVVFILGAFGIVFTLIYKKKQQSNQQEKQLLENRYEQALLRSKVEIQEETLKHISRELHDNLGHAASLIKINLTTIQLSQTEKTLEKIENSKELCRQLISDIKSLSVSLNSDRVSRIGFYRSLEAEVVRLKKADQFRIELMMQETLPDIDKDRSLILFRMMQEIFHNALKHAAAEKIVCQVRFAENILHLVISDDGVGFDLSQRKIEGSGIDNLLSRSAMIHARVEIDSREGAGTTVTIQLPI